MFIAQMENKSKKTMFFIEYTLEMCFIFAEAVQFPKCFRVCILEFFFSLNWENKETIEDINGGVLFHDNRWNGGAAL